MEALFEKAAEWATYFNAQELANVVWAAGTLRYSKKRLMAAFSEAAWWRVAELAPQGMSNVLWAFAKLEMRDAMPDGFADDLIAAAVHRVREFDGQSLATFSWAVTKLELPGACSFLGAAEACMSDVAPQLTVQSITLLLSALAKRALANLQTPAQLKSELLSVLVVRTTELMPKMQADELAIACWAVAVVALPLASRPCLKQLNSAVRRRLPSISAELGWRSIAHIEFGMRSLGSLADGTLQELGSRWAVLAPQIQEESLQYNSAPARFFSTLKLPRPSAKANARAIVVGEDAGGVVETAMASAGLSRCLDVC